MVDGHKARTTLERVSARSPSLPTATNQSAWLFSPPGFPHLRLDSALPRRSPSSRSGRTCSGASRCCWTRFVSSSSNVLTPARGAVRYAVASPIKPAPPCSRASQRLSPAFPAHNNSPCHSAVARGVPAMLLPDGSCCAPSSSGLAFPAAHKLSGGSCLMGGIIATPPHLAPDPTRSCCLPRRPRSSISSPWSGVWRS